MTDFRVGRCDLRETAERKNSTKQKKRNLYLNFSPHSNLVVFWECEAPAKPKFWQIGKSAGRQFGELVIGELVIGELVIDAVPLSIPPNAKSRFTILKGIKSNADFEIVASWQ